MLAMGVKVSRPRFKSYCSEQASRHSCIKKWTKAASKAYQFAKMVREQSAQHSRAARFVVASLCKGYLEPECTACCVTPFSPLESVEETLILSTSLHSSF